jgi:hypothetical protein
MATRNRYSPLNKEAPVLYTKGFEYSLNGKNYVGEYYDVNGVQYAGRPTSPVKQQLRRYYENNDLYTFDKLANFGRSISTYKQPKFVIIEPKPQDYSIGYINRYLVQYVLDLAQVPIEIGDKARGSYGQPSGIDPNLYDLVEVKWQLTGPLNDKTIPTGIVPGIIESNQRTVLKLSQKYPSIIYAFRNYSEFANITIS